MNRRTEESVNLASVATVAAVVGVAAGLLLAPRKGSETRDKIKLKMQEAKQKSIATVDTAKDKAQDTVDKVKVKTNESTETAKDAVTEARSQVEDIAEEVQTRQRARRGGVGL